MARVIHILVPVLVPVLNLIRSRSITLPHLSRPSESPLSTGDITRYHSASPPVSIVSLATTDLGVAGSSPSRRTIQGGTRGGVGRLSLTSKTSIPHSRVSTKPGRTPILKPSKTQPVRSTHRLSLNQIDNGQCVIGT
jgi:hypothetical protein